VVLAAGRPGDTFPDNSKQKVLYHVNGEVLLERLVLQLREAGIEDIRLVTGYGAEGIKKFNRDRKLGLELVYNPKWDEDKGAESIRVGVEDLNDDALIVYADILANTQIFKRFLECEAPLAWIKTIIPWGPPLPVDDEVYKNDRHICIVKIAKEKLIIFEKENAEKYITEIGDRCGCGRGGKGNMAALLLEGMYQNGPVEEIVIPSPIWDIDYYDRTDEGNPIHRSRPPKLGSGEMEHSREREGEPPVFSVVIPTTHGEGKREIGSRMRNCMKSIMNQTLQPLEIIVADYGSTKDGHEEIMKVLEPFDCSVYYYPDTDGIWNLSKARNMGIRRSQCENVVAVDADVILEPRVMEVLSQAHASRPRSFISCFARFLKPDAWPGGPTDLDFPEGFLKLREMEFWPSAGWGTVVSAPRSWLFKVMGFDERMKFWGAEDKDMWKRAGLDNMDRYRINDLGQEDTEIYHQFHDDCLSWDQTRLTKEEEAQIKWNKLLAERDYTLIRNNDNWGLWGTLKTDKDRYLW